MWILNWLPSLVFYIILLAGLVGLIVSKFTPTQYRVAVQALSALLFVFGVFMSGAISDNDAWQMRVKELEVKLAQAEIESQKENVKIVENVVTKTQVVKQKGQDVIRYIDREVTKYDTQCIIPKEFIEAHNKAAEQPK